MKRYELITQIGALEVKASKHYPVLARALALASLIAAVAVFRPVTSAFGCALFVSFVWTLAKLSAFTRSKNTKVGSQRSFHRGIVRPVALAVIWSPVAVLLVLAGFVCLGIVFGSAYAAGWVFLVGVCLTLTIELIRDARKKPTQETIGLDTAEPNKNREINRG
jgi:hypothetical protein